MLANGADVTARDFEGNTALKAAEANEHDEVVKMLKQAGAKE